MKTDIERVYNELIAPKLVKRETISVGRRTYLQKPEWWRGSGGTEWTVSPSLASALVRRGLVEIRTASDGWRYIA